MRFFRMCYVAWRLSWPYVLAPWYSPLLRWRLETYGVCDTQGRLLHADEITPACFLRFTLSRLAALWRFLGWAAEL